ncbi:MAG: NHLP bacteriocin system secretion protein [Hyphomicrobiaceae bacterium]
MDESFYRSEALEAQSRIDRLPQAMRVTSSLTRATLALLGLGLVVATGWSGFVEVPVRVQGSGLFVDPSGDLLKPVRAPMEGVIEAFLVAEGDEVHAGQPVARLQLPDRQAALVKAERNLASLEDQYRRTMSLQEVERNGEDRARQIKVKSLDNRVSDLELRLAWSRDLESAQVRLLERGATTMPHVIEAKGTVLQTIDQLAEARGELSAQLADILVSEGRRERERLSLQLEIDQARADIAALRVEIARGTVLNSPVEGTVAELSADRNGLVTGGQTVLSIIPTNGESRIEAVAYISMADGKLVKAGDEVLLRPASLPHTEQGMIRARVEGVSDAPISERALTRVLGNAKLVDKASDQGAPFSVRISLVRDETTPSGYAWTSGSGPVLRLSPGTPITARITIERATLLSLAVPALRRLLLRDETGWAGR